MVATEIQKLIDSGAFKKLTKTGVISPTIEAQFEIYKAYMVKERKGAKVCDAVFDVAEEMRVSEMTVYRAIRKMLQPTL